MGQTIWPGIWLLLRAGLAGSILTLAPLLLLEDLAQLLQALLASPMAWPDWASLPFSIAVGVLVAASVGLRRRWEAVPRWEVLAQRVVRYALVFILCPYALSKVLRTQFRVPYVVLDTPLGDVSGYMLAWRFFGYSHGHEWFVALGEWIGPALLLGWRTTTFGACITAVVLTNVVAVNFTHALPVQRFSSCLLAVTCYLVLLDGPRLLRFFVFNQPVEPQPRPAPLIRSRWFAAGLKTGWFALALAYSFTLIAWGDSRPTPVAGAWKVEVDGTQPAVAWRTVYFERGLTDHYPGSVRREADARPERFRYEIDAANRHIRMTFANKTALEQRFEGTYEVQEAGELWLRGVLDERAVAIRLVRKR
jgi:hypothetical protein